MVAKAKIALKSATFVKQVVLVGFGSVIDPWIYYVTTAVT